MELQTLDSSFQAVNSVDSYESLIWSERYSSNGDFQLVSSDITTIMRLLPLESVVKLRESTVPMVVESHQISKPLRDIPKIVVKGRSFETVLERRTTLFDLTNITTVPLAVNMAAGQASDAAFKAIRYVIGDVARADLGVQVPRISPDDAIPQIELVTPSDYISSAAAWVGTTAYVAPARVLYNGQIWEAVSPNTNVPPATTTPQWKFITGWTNYEIARGYLYQVVMDLLNTNHHGFKSVVPLPTGNKIRLEIYNGADLRDKIAFDARLDQFDDSNYLLSFQGSANVAYVAGPTGGQIVMKNKNPDGTPVTKSGLARRVLLVDATSDTILNSDIGRYNRGILELYKANATALFDGETSVQVASLFNRVDGYFLGDIVKLNGDYGLSRNVRVAEFIRTSDSSGEKAFPAFEAIDEG